MEYIFYFNLVFYLKHNGISSTKVITHSVNEKVLGHPYKSLIYTTVQKIIV